MGAAATRLFYISEQTAGQSGLSGQRFHKRRTLFSEWKGLVTPRGLICLLLFQPTGGQTVNAYAAQLDLIEQCSSETIGSNLCVDHARSQSCQIPKRHMSFSMMPTFSTHSQQP